jgi:hypothetical protein
MELLSSLEGIVMPVTRWLLLTVPVVAAVLTSLLLSYRSVAAPDPTPPETPTRPAGVEVEVKCVDDSTLKLKLLDDKLELVTKYGFLQINVADIRKIEFAPRCPPEVAEKIAAAISRLGHADFGTRERATAELKSYRERAYPFLLKTLKHDDPEVSRRAEEAVRAIQSRVPAALLEMRDTDVVYTEDSRISGRLTAQSLRVVTGMFGEQTLKLADLRSLRSGSGTTVDEFAGAVPAPTNLSAYQQQWGKELTFLVTGQVGGNGPHANVWGTDVYTLDSNLAAAAVHAGVVRPGEAGVVRVRVVPSPPQYIPSSRNGVNSNGYGNYPAGGFEFVRR